MRKKTALIIHSCDAYEILLQGFFHFFSKHKGMELPFDKYLLMETSKIVFSGVRTLQTGPGPWTDRLRRALMEDNLSSYDAILYFQEDFWMKSNFNEALLMKSHDYFQEHQLNLLKLHGCLKYKAKKVTGEIDGRKIYLLDLKSQYLMSHQVSFWQRDFFIQQLQVAEGPWENEKKGTRRLRDKGGGIHHLDYFTNNDNPLLNSQLPVEETVHYDTVSNKGLFNNYSDYFISVLLQESPEYGRELLRRREQNIHHKGHVVEKKKSLLTKIQNFLS